MTLVDFRYSHEFSLIDSTSLQSQCHPSFIVTKQGGIEVFRADSRLEDREAVAAELDKIKPTHVLNAAGITGRPNIDWCETNKPETIRTNVIGTLNLADLCYIRNIHVKSLIRLQKKMFTKCEQCATRLHFRYNAWGGSKYGVHQTHANYA